MTIYLVKIILEIKLSLLACKLFLKVLLNVLLMLINDA